MAADTAARAAALDLLGAVLRRKHPLDEALETTPSLTGLSGRDRAFARALASTVLRRFGQTEALLDRFLDKRLARKAAVVEDILRLGMVQLLFLDTAPHAAVDTAVRLAVEHRQPHLKKLVNAVLRRVGREKADLLAGQDAARLNTPDWLWESWSAAYGAETARAIAEAHLAEPPLDITAKTDPDAWTEPLEATLLPTGSLRRAPGGPVTALPGFAEGAWWVQDAAAALPARLLGDVAGKRVIDLCAAPGGKTAQLAAAGGRVTAVERSEKRLRRLGENLERLGLAAETVTADAVEWRPPEPADAVLLDAPCSATGTIRRHPDVALLKKPEDVAKLAALQERLLAAAAEMVRPGGVIVFCTCSLQPEEGPERVVSALAGGLPLTPLPVTAPEVGGLAELVTPEGFLRTLPCHLSGQGGLDGFFAARFRRT